MTDSIDLKFFGGLAVTLLICGAIFFVLPHWFTAPEPVTDTVTGTVTNKYTDNAIPILHYRYLVVNKTYIYLCGIHEYGGFEIGDHVILTRTFIEGRWRITGIKPVDQPET